MKNYQSQLLEWRHHLHSHPELSWAEVETTRYITEELKKMGVENIAHPLKTGVVAEISNGTGKTVALRADIDALPIAETNTCDYKSKNEDVMHACGHDVHTTCLLGATKYLLENKDQWNGTIRLIFQPSEEKMPSGAEAMIEKGVLKDVESIIGLHVTPELECGKVGFRKGDFMASADEIYMNIIGKGGHGASPENCIDPIVVSANIIISLQNIVSRMANPKIPSVLTFGDIQGHGATNIIPDKVSLKGTFRTFDEKWRTEAKSKIISLSQKIAEGYGAKCEIEMKGMPSVYNDPELTNKLRKEAEKLFGKENVVTMPQRMGAEDFAYYSQQIPACFFRLGTGSSEATRHSVHTSVFDIDEEALMTGSYAMAMLGVGMLG